MLNIRTLNLLLLASTTLFASAAVQAADIKAGQSLHDANCLKCHDSSVYTREDRKVTTLDGLRKQVKRCDLSLGLTWFDDQVEDVVQYLNSSYYKIK
jgi:predicted lipase